MFLELHNPKTGKRMLLNVDLCLAIIEDESPVAKVVSIAGHQMPLALSFDLVKAGLDDDDDERTSDDRGRPAARRLK